MRIPLDKFLNYIYLSYEKAEKQKIIHQAPERVEDKKVQGYDKEEAVWLINRIKNMLSSDEYR